MMKFDSNRPVALPAAYEGPTEVTDPDALEEVFRFRAAVWADEAWLSKHQNMSRIADRHEGDARHWVVRQRGQLVAAARLSFHERIEDVPDYEFFPTRLPITIPPPIASMNRLVVHPAHRYQGIATNLDRCRIQAAKQSGANAILVQCPPYRVQRLCQLGFKPIDWTRNPFAGEIPTTIVCLDMKECQNAMGNRTPAAALE
jgi:GNAT superfamily N-acetyltransferase